MDYKQKYEESLEKARIYRNHLIETGDDVGEIEYIFPELINDDERIIRKFIEALKLCGFTHFDNEFTVQEAIDWLEKQCEQKSNNNTGPKFKVGDWVQINGGHVMNILEVKKRCLML